MSDKPHRRRFIQDTLLFGAALVEASSLESLIGQESATHFPARHLPRQLVQLADDLFLYQDTCNVFVVRSGESAVLIDLGSGRVLEFLSQAGIHRVSGILLTHHHRDQCQGHERATTQGIPIAVPEHEQFYFSQVGDFWQGRRLAELYNMQNNFFSLTDKAAATAIVEDYQRISWRDTEFFILPSPGHTPGSITVIAESAKRKVAFTGDLIRLDGRVETLHDLQYNYAATDGIDLACHSLLELKKHDPELLCPSHGPVIEHAVQAIDSLRERFRRWYTFYNSPAALLTEDCQLHPVSPHLICQNSKEQIEHTAAVVVQHISPRFTSTAAVSPNFYAILSRTRKALLVDFGVSTWNVLYSGINSCTPEGTLRFIRHSLDELLTEYSIQKIDVCIPTHAHDENVAGITYLQAQFGTRVYCLSSIAEVLSRPGRFNAGAQWKYPIKIDRHLENGETFEWEEYRFTVVRCPGHTEFQMAMSCEIDGERVVFCGDALARSEDRIKWDLTFRNSVEADSHLQAIRAIEGLNPTLLASTHGPTFRVERDDFRRLAEQFERQQVLFEDLIAGEAVNEGINPHWISLVPFHQVARPGDEISVSLHVKSYRLKTIDVEATLIVPAPWRFDPELASCTLQPGHTGTLHFRVGISNEARWPARHVVLADLIIDGRYLGQRAESIVFVDREREMHLV